jgi:hypothetical protein
MSPLIVNPGSLLQSGDGGKALIELVAAKWQVQWLGLEG